MVFANNRVAFTLLFFYISSNFLDVRGDSHVGGESQRDHEEELLEGEGEEWERKMNEEKGNVNGIIFYLSPNGNDSFTGLLPSPNPTNTDGPFLTPFAAQLAVLAVPRPLAGTVTIYVREGLYELNQTLVLGPGSGGDSPDSSVLWTKYPSDSGQAIFSGGVRISNWTETSQPGIYKANLPMSAPIRSRSLFETFANGESARRTPARVPMPAGSGRENLYSDESTLHYVGLLDHSPLDAPCWGSKANESVNQWGFVFNSSDSRSPKSTWADVTGLDVLVFGAWTASWASVASIHEDNSSLIVTNPLTSAVPGQWGGRGCPSGARFVLFNAYEGLVPGSGYFYVNDSSREIFYAPYVNEDMTSLQLSVPVLSSVVSLSGDDCGGPLFSITFSDLSIRHASDGGCRESDQGNDVQSGSFTLSTATDVSLINMEFSNSDGSGIYLTDFLTRVSIINCSVTSVGGDGIGLKLVYEDVGSYPRNTTIFNNSISGVGHVFFGQPSGIRVQGDPSGTVNVSHNLVSSSTYAGIMIGWQSGSTRPSSDFTWQFIVQNNKVENCGLSTLSDFGGIYVSSAGYSCETTESCYLPTLVTDNFVSNVNAYNYGGEGVYTDENVAGVSVVNNVLANVSGTGIYFHCGDNLTAVNNLVFSSHIKPFVSSENGFSNSGLLNGCNTGGVDPKNTNTSSFISNNVFIITQAGGTIFTHGALYPVANETYRNNVYWAENEGLLSSILFPVTSAINSTLKEWQTIMEEDLQSVISDPLVADLNNGNYTLLNDSPALILGFKQLKQEWGPM